MERIAQLLWHSYVLTASTAHVMLDYPLPSFPTFESFAEYVRTA